MRSGKARGALASVDDVLELVRLGCDESAPAAACARRSLGRRAPASAVAFMAWDLYYGASEADARRNALEAVCGA